MRPVWTVGTLTLFALSLSAQEGRRRATPQPVRTSVGGGSSEGAVGVDRDMPRRSGGGHARETAMPRPMHRPLTEADIAGVPRVPAAYRAMTRCTFSPDFDYWGRRDLMGEIQWMARRGFIPVTPLPTAEVEVKGFSQIPAGWRAYGFVVPAGATMRIDLVHAKPGWFRTVLMDKWGAYRPGMMAKPGEPSSAYVNKTGEAQAIYLLVDDPGWWATEKEPYTLKLTRSWDPASFDASKVPMSLGIWGIEAHPAVPVLQ